MILTASLLLLSLPAPPPLSGGEVVLLKDKPSRKFSYVLPGERWGGPIGGHGWGWHSRASHRR